MMGLDDVKGVANVVNGNHLIDGQKPCSLVLIKYVLVHVPIEGRMIRSVINDGIELGLVSDAGKAF